jgi:hypothetical protein
MLVRILPAVRKGDSPGVLLQFNSFGTQTGRRYTCRYSPLGLGFGCGSDQAHRQSASA